MGKTENKKKMSVVKKMMIALIGGLYLANSFLVSQQYIPLKAALSDQLLQQWLSPQFLHGSGMDRRQDPASAVHGIFHGMYILRAADLICRYHLRPHGPDQHHHPFGFGAAIQNIGTLPQMILRHAAPAATKLGTLVHDPHRPSGNPGISI